METESFVLIPSLDNSMISKRNDRTIIDQSKSVNVVESRNVSGMLDLKDDGTCFDSRKSSKVFDELRK